MNYGNLFKYWRTVLTVAEMSLRNQFSEGFIIFAVIFQPMIIAVLALFMLKDKGGDYAMFARSLGLARTKSSGARASTCHPSGRKTALISCS